MNPEEIESNIKDHSNQLIRLDERIKNLNGINERVARLNNYFQICGILLLLLGIGGGFLVSRFFDAQREIGRLTTQVADSEKILASQVEKAKKDFDSHVGSNPTIEDIKAELKSGVYVRYSDTIAIRSKQYPTHVVTTLGLGSDNGAHVRIEPRSDKNSGPQRWIIENADSKK